MLFFTPVERMIAWRYLRARRTEGFLSVMTVFAILGIMLGVATLILVTSLMNGIRDEMRRQLIGIDGHVSVYASGPGLADHQALAEMLRVRPGVVSVIPKVEGQVMASHQGIALGAQVFGLTPEGIAAKQALADKVDASLLAQGGVILGSRLADNLHLRPGDNVTLISPEGRATIAGLVPRIKAYPVAGTFSLGVHMLDASLILMPMEEAQVYFRKGSQEERTISALEISLANADDAQAFAKNLADELGEGYRVYNWRDSNAGIFHALKVQRNVMVIILGLIILVAAFNIVSSLILLVKEKASAVAMLRTLGMTRRNVLRLFVLIGVTIGAIGTTLGGIVGVLLAQYLDAIKRGIESLMGQELLVGEIYFLNSLPTRTSPIEVFLVMGLAMAFAFFATIYPAWRASTLDPAEVLRYE